MTLYPNRCRSCAAPIRWERTAAGKMAPISVATGESHFIDCPQRRDWRKREPALPAAPRAVAAADDGQRPLFDDEAE